MTNFKALVGTAVLGAMMLAGATAAAEGPSGSTGPTVNDHNSLVGRVGVGYLGASQVVVGYDGSRAANTMTLPTIGARYWIDESLGLDLGIGLALESGSSSKTPPSESDGETVTVDDPSFFAFMVHAGVPLALGTGKHYCFQIIPELNFGYGSGSQDINNPYSGEKMGSVSHSGMRLDAGVRAGAELHFGFMGVPELSLQGSVGLLFRMDSYKTKAKSDEGDDLGTEKRSTTRLATTVNDSPWNIFTANVAALYYF